MRLTRYLKKMAQFSLKEKADILFFSFGSFIYERVNRNISETYLVFSRIHRLGLAISKFGDSNVVTTQINNKVIKVFLRRDSSDAQVFNQVILDEEYNDVLRVFQTKGMTMKTMIDAGANIGLASIYFKAFYPDLKIVALEPSGETFQQLAKNIAVNELCAISAFEQGLWKENTFLQLDKSFRDKSDWSFRLVAGKNEKLNTIKTKNVDDILKENQWEYIDFLKIDVEGAEAVIFENQDVIRKWIPNVKVIALEIHDEVNCRQNIYTLLERNNFSLLESKSLTIAINSALI